VGAFVVSWQVLLRFVRFRAATQQFAVFLLRCGIADGFQQWFQIRVSFSLPLPQKTLHL
jgi:hypothetical protein